MNILIDELPKTVWVNEREYDIRWEFRYSILYELMMSDTLLSVEERIARGLELYYPVIPKEQEEAAAAALWFYRCAGKGRESKGSSRVSSGQTLYSFDYDDRYIYAAFWEQYGINLNTADLHWWEFRALFWALNEGCMLSKIMGYRGIEISKDMTKAQKEFYQRMKELYKLPVNEDEQEKLEAIDAALMGDGDLRGML